MQEFIIIYKIKGIEGRCAIRSSEVIDCPEIAKDLWDLRLRDKDAKFERIEEKTIN